jgi:hypothetical protein
MKTIEINDEVYDNLKAFVVDPFDDTPNAVLMRLIHIANKAQDQWSPFATSTGTTSPYDSVPAQTRIPETGDESDILLL